MNVTHATPDPDLDLDALLASLDEAPLEEPTPAVEAEALTESDLQVAVATIERQEVINRHYEEEAQLEALFAPVIAKTADAPATPVDIDGEVLEKAVEEVTKPKKERKPREAKPETERKAPVRKHYASKTERLQDKLGAALGDYTVLELADSLLEGDALKAKQDETMLALKEAGVKVQNRMTFFMEFVSGRSSKLNEVAKTALKLLHTEGKIGMGEKGNLYLALLAHPYSSATAKAMGGNTILAMKLLKMISQGEKGEYVPNPNSLYLMKLNSMLGFE